MVAGAAVAMTTSDMPELSRESTAISDSGYLFPSSKGGGIFRDACWRCRKKIINAL